MVKGAVLLSVVMLLAGMMTGQTAGQQSARGKTKAAGERPQAHAAMSAEQAEAVRADLRKMRALLEQMENNLGAVESGPTPLKHQFELQIEMWRALLDHMQRMAQAEGQQK